MEAQAAAELAGQHHSGFPPVASLASALHTGEEVFREAQQKATTLPKLADGRGPVTLADAINLREAKEEEKRRRELARKDIKVKGKQVTPLPAVTAAAAADQPGLNIGNPQEAAAWWMFVEDYFRDVTQEDIMALLPVALSPEEDEALTVPFLGRDPRGMDRPAQARGKQVTGCDDREDDAQERRGRGRIGSSVDLQMGDAAPGSEPFLPQPLLAQPQAADALLQGWRPDGRPAATMMEACTDEEVRSFCVLAQKMGLLDEGLSTEAMDRAQLDQLLTNVSQIGYGGGTGGGAVPGTGADAADEDTQSSSKGLGQELPRAACGDYMHPYLQRILERPCTAYVLNPSAGAGSLIDVLLEEEDAPTQPETRGGARGGRVARDTSMAKTPAAGRTSLKMYGSASQDITPLQGPVEASNSMGGAYALGAQSSTGVQPHMEQLQQLPPLPPHTQQQQQGFLYDSAGPGGLLSGATPVAGGPGSAADKAAAGGSGPRGGRARNAINYSALAGRKDKERDRELREREREDRERAKTVMPKVKRKPGPKGGASWGSGAGSGMQRPTSNNPLLNKAPLLFKDDPGSSSVAAAVHAAVAEGGPEGDLEEQWAQLDAATDVMAMAPDDEVLAELLALQSELVQQAAINRARVAQVLEAAIADLPNQRAVNAQRAEWEDQIRTYLQRKAEAKRNAKREKREMEKRQAVAALNDPASPKAGRPKKFAGMPPGGYDAMGGGLAAEGGENGEAWRGATPGMSGGEGAPMDLAPPIPADFELVDCLAQRTHDEEALCAICADGLSLDPNMIVFCERCDIAVHQHCYGVRSIPAEEWLCWPCRMYEEQQRAAGVEQNEIRPKRWEMEARGITAAELPGGSHAVGCCLCPVRHGAFKRTVDGKAWCHVVCGLWQEGTNVLPVDSPDAVDNVSNIKGDRWRQPCGLCNQMAGAVVKCNFGHCQAYFHPLCGRRAGNYLVARAQPGSRTVRYRAYCHNHSDAQRGKDSQTGAAARASDMVNTVPGAKGGRRGASSSGASLTGAAPGSMPLDGTADGPYVQGGMDMSYGEGDAAANMAAPALGGPFKKKFGRPPKVQKQQQLLQLQMASTQSGMLGIGQDGLQGGMGLTSPMAPTPGAVPGVGMVPPGYDSAQAQQAAEAAGGMAAGGPGRPPLPGSRLSLTAMARRKAELAAAVAGADSGAGAYGLGLQPGVKMEAGDDELRAGGRATTSKTSSGTFPGGRGAGAKAAAGKARPSYSGAAAATTSSGGKQRGRGVAVKEEPSAEGNAAAAAAAAMAAARLRAAAGGAATSGSSGGVTLERLAELEYQKSLLGRFVPSSVRNELELLRTLADTVRRRERCKRAQYRLLGEALALQDTNPAAVLAFFENWEWSPAEDQVGPFSAEDLLHPPTETILDRFLAVGEKVAAGAGAAAAATTAAAAAAAAPEVGAGVSAAPSAAPVIGVAAPAAAAPAAAAAPSPAPGAAPGLGISGLKRQRVPSALAVEAAAAAMATPVSPPAKRLKLKQKVLPAAVAAASGPAPSASDLARTSSRSHRGATAAAAAPFGDAAAEVGSAEQQDLNRSDAGKAAEVEGQAGAGDASGRIMSGRDWRKRVVPGPGGQWMPRDGLVDKASSAGKAGAGSKAGSEERGKVEHAGGRDEAIGQAMAGDLQQADAEMVEAVGVNAVVADGGDGGGGAVSTSPSKRVVGAAEANGTGGGDDGEVRSGGGNNDEGGGKAEGGGKDENCGCAESAPAAVDSQEQRGGGGSAGAPPIAAGGGDGGGAEAGGAGDGEVGPMDSTKANSDGDHDDAEQDAPRRGRSRQVRQGSLFQQLQRGGKGKEAAAAAADAGGAGNRKRKASLAEGTLAASPGDSPAAALRELPRDTRTVMSQRAAEELNARLPRGFRYERRPEGGDR